MGVIMGELKTMVEGGERGVVIVGRQISGARLPGEENGFGSSGFVTEQWKKKNWESRAQRVRGLGEKQPEKRRKGARRD